MPSLIRNSSPDDAGLEPIAICGMACRLPGKVDSPSSLWELLLKKGSGNNSKVPSSRFNIDAHYHKNNERPGSFNVLGGYFIDGPAENFDPTFFNLTPVEAMWLDPQQRKMLEVCYEAIESAGLTLESLSGSNTGVYIGSFTADYQQMTFKDPDFRHSYAATGVDPGIISNRIGNVFDLNGPSFTINTACSSSVYAIHNACHALRAGDCEAALVGGVNLVLTVDQHMNTAKLGVLSPSSFCHTFDASADGYGRGEGAGAIYLKKLSDAIRDGDIVRAVIRSSAVNTNGKVPGYGITFPNKNGQERVIRAAYKRANLDPDKTAYFECHGTGTAVGDPIEVRAVSNAMNDTRSKDKPLIIGAIKPNIGHSEAASGVFAVMKAALMVEKGVIPGVAGLKTINPQIPEDKLNVKVARDTMQWPDGFFSRRASVSSFGYGGTNGHVIVEAVNVLEPQYQQGAPKEVALYDHSSTRPLLVTFSAHDKTTLLRNVDAHAKVADQYYLTDLAYTLNLRRSRFAQRGFVVAKESSVVEDLTSSLIKIGSNSKGINELGFIFTGQGAQWAGVGREAIKAFPVFRDTIRKFDFILKNLEHPPNFSIEEELSAPAETSRINDANVAQPTLVATELAIVDLLASWKIFPTATVGHSAGEYAAAYAAGLASAPEIIIAAYYRGYCLEKFAPSGGSMLAVGKGVDEVEEYLHRLDPKIVVACENSPSSVTLSGPATAIQEAKDMFTEEKIFARELKTGMAYHSPYMTPVAEPMVEFTRQAYRKLDSYDRQWRMPRRPMISSVTNSLMKESQMGPHYWASNLTGRVLFTGAVKTLATMEDLSGITGFLEIGPHSALAGPFKQICQANDLKGLTYIPTIIRNQDSAKSLLNTAGELFLNNYPVDLYQVNKVEAPFTSEQSWKARDVKPYPLVDLPPYQWNYEKMFFAEPRMSAEYRQLTHARHDLLGSKMLGLSHNAMVWRNMLRLKDIPWLKDHKLGGSIIFPAAGHMALAIEATRQHCEMKKIDIVGATVRNLELKTGLIIPETDAGLEIQLRLSQISSQDGVPTFSFAVESCTGDIWSTHSEGTVTPVTPQTVSPTRAQHPVNAENLTQRHTGKRWNDTFKRVGFEYGPSFNALDKIRTSEKIYQAAGQIPVEVASNLMIDESRYLLHPSAVDELLQLCIISIHAGQHQMPWGVIPVKFEEITIMQPSSGVGKTGQAVAWNNVRGDRARHFNTDAQLATESGEVIIDIKGLHTVSYEAALPPQRDAVVKAVPYVGTVWQPWSPSTESNGTTDKQTDVALVYSALHSAVPNALADALTKLGIKVQVKAIGDVDANKDRNIILYNPAGNLLTHAETASFDALKEIIPSGASILWLTNGVNEGTSTSGGAVAGFLRVLREEQKMSKLTVLDFDKNETFHSIAQTVNNIISPAEETREHEYWLHGGVCHVARVIPNDDVNDRMVVDEEKLVEKSLPRGQLFQAVFNGTEFIFKPSDALEQNVIKPNEIAIQVEEFEFNEKDIKTAADGPRLVSGTVVDAGNAVSKTLLGKNVLAWASNPFDTIIRTPASACAEVEAKYAKKLMEILPGVTQAANALSGITDEKKVLLLPTSSATVRSYAQLSKVLGFSLTIVRDEKTQQNGFSGAGSDKMSILSTEEVEKIRALMAEAGSSLIVVAQDFSSFSQDIWRNIPAAASFVLNESKQGSLSSSPDVDPFKRGARFSVSSVSSSFSTDPAALGKTLSSTVSTLLNSSSFELPNTTSFGTLKDVLKAPRDYKVVTYNYDAEPVNVVPSAFKLNFSPDVAYLLVGCLGGLGRSLATFMMERGAKHFAFISRSGADKPEAAQLIKSIQEAGAVTQVFRGDAGNPADVARAVEEITKERPIKGVVHAAMVLQDGMLGPNMTVSKFKAALGPKIDGAQVLHHALKNHDLDFFVMTSSISATVGQPGQSNYAAANSFLDTLAWHRNLSGLPATSLVLPMVLGVGVVAENDSLEEKITRRGMYGIDEAEMLRGFETAMSQPIPTITKENMHLKQGDSTIILGLEPSRLAAALAAAGGNTDIEWISDCRFSELSAIVSTFNSGSASSSSSNNNSSIADQLTQTWQSAGYDAALTLAADLLMQKCSSILMLEKDSFELEGKSIGDYGLDSMIGAELRNWLFKECRLNIAFQELLSATLSFKGLSVRVLEGFDVKV